MKQLPDYHHFVLFLFSSSQQHEHRRHRLPSGAAVQGRGLGGLSGPVRHRGRPAHQEWRPAAGPGQRGGKTTRCRTDAPASDVLKSTLIICVTQRLFLSVQQGGDVRDGLAGQVLQLLQEGALPVRQQVQQHRVRVQTQRDADPHVDQQGGVQLRTSCCWRRVQSDVCHCFYCFMKNTVKSSHLLLVFKRFLL